MLSLTKTKLDEIAITFIVLSLLLLPISIADDSYKPYLHKATVPEHPKVKLYGSYSTQLFPGVATYTYPIEIPRGTNGLQPLLSISYNNQNIKQRPGILGSGWELTQSYIYRDVNSTLDNLSDDEFKLILNGNFNDLIYDSNDAFHRTKIDSFIRIQNFTGGNNTYGLYWIATAKDGTKYRFGYTNETELESNTGKSYALRWSLDQINDTHGNAIFYSYSEDPHTEDEGSVYLTKIEYNNDRKRVIEFTYESNVRPDKRTIYFQGNILNESRRLANINVTADGNLVREYDFEYVSLTAEKSLSALAKITYIGSDGTSVLHTVSFDYHTPNTGFTKYDGTEWIPPTSLSDDDNDFGARLIDVNNDGFLDVVKNRKTTSENKTWINNRDNNWTSTNDWLTPTWITKSGTVDELVYTCYDGQCNNNCGGICNYDKCFVSGCQCGQGSWAFRGEDMCFYHYYNGYNTKTVDIDNGVKFADVNNDGLVDILQGTDSGAVKKAWTNNGTQWVEASQWNPPIYFFEADVDVGVQLVDFNGDGRVDILQSKFDDGEIKKAYENNGTGWTDVSSTWSAPTYFMRNKEDNGVRIEDVNADGLPDILESRNNGTVIIKAWLNNGGGWVESSVWEPPVMFITDTRTDNGVRFFDINGDDLPDIVQALSNSSGGFRNTWINNGNGWTLNNSWESPEVFTTGKNTGRRVSDINGDGFADILVAQTNASGSFYWSWVRNDSIPFMLKKITNEFGGVTSIDYQKSTQFSHNGTDSFSDLGFNVWVVGNVTNNNSMDNAFSATGITKYVYANGSYDYQDFEFRGFERVNETLPDNSTLIHFFHQDDARKGSEFKTEMYNSTGSIFSKVESVFNFTNGTTFKVFLKSQASYLHDGVFAKPNITNVSYSYDNFGNIVGRVQHGDINVSGDEKFERYFYSINTSAWIVGRLSLYQLFAADNSTKVSDVKYSYDGLPYGSNATRGDVTEVESWISPSVNGRHVVKFEYDGYGNLIRETDPLGRVTRYTFGIRDSTFTYPDIVTNALFHTTSYRYDLGTGNLLWQFSDNVNTSFHYDTFGRIVKEVEPLDSFFLPTKNYTYIFDGTAPEIIKVNQRTTANKTYDTYFYYDGFANFIQFKRPADGNQQIIKNLFYDGLGRIVSEQNPYFDSFSTGLSTPSATVNRTNYTFDALGRVTFLRNPDGTNKTITFNHRLITAYDENNHKKSYLLDGYDRISNVLEYNNNPILDAVLNVTSEEVYNTSYEYDTQDNLVKITDALGNKFTFGYDSLGRRIYLSDPDLGNWSYQYDLAGNLITQRQNGGGNLVSGDGYYREYDGLNQLIRIRNNTATGAVVEEYSYNPFGQRIKIKRNDTANTTIYTPFKELMRIKNSTGTFDFTYIYQEGVLVARVNPDGTKYFYHPDHLGSTTLITNGTGSIVENTYYSPYGELLGGGGADVRLYTGQLKDGVLCQYYYGRRYFSPCQGRFIQFDPTIPNPYNPQYLNRYAYALNNPYRYVDTTGLWAVQFGLSGSAGAGGGLSEERGYVISYGETVGFQLGSYVTKGSGYYVGVGVSAMGGTTISPHAKSIQDISGKSVTTTFEGSAQLAAASVGVSYKPDGNKVDTTKPTSVSFQVGGSIGTPLSVQIFETNTEVTTILNVPNARNIISADLSSKYNDVRSTLSIIERDFERGREELGNEIRKGIENIVKNVDDLFKGIFGDNK